ncbi:hypothetical protein SNE85_002336 [Vibrio cholerae]|uniref:8-oxoguanine DNA glycosylase OGG fold protein n=1 Tax=Vibrio cholerae TaxID=666 RepID=UPI002A0E39FF|nr:hypothetical protein [Vibrio cholerae]
MLPAYLHDNIFKIQQTKQPRFKIAAQYHNYRHYEVINEILTDCKDWYIGRQEVTKYFEQQCVYKGFFAAMIWGGVSTGGVTGDNLSKMLSVEKSRLESIIIAIRALLESQKFADAYHYMEKEGKIDGLGDAYFTKLFFFITLADRMEIKAPIFDKWTKLAYCALLIDEGHENIAKSYISRVDGEIVLFRAASRAAAFEDFVQRMNRWASECGVDVNQLESFIFGTHRGKDRSTNNPRCYFESFVSEKNADIFGLNANVRQIVSRHAPVRNYSTQESAPAHIASELNDFAAQYRSLKKAPSQDQLFPMLICYFKQSDWENINCRDLAYSLQDQFGFWDLSKSTDKRRAAYDAIATFFVYGEQREHREKYISNVHRREKFLEVLKAKLVVSEVHNRAFTLIAV